MCGAVPLMFKVGGMVRDRRQKSNRIDRIYLASISHVVHQVRHCDTAQPSFAPF
jgi:hypothetical protein